MKKILAMTSNSTIASLICVLSFSVGVSAKSLSTSQKQKLSVTKSKPETSKRAVASVRKLTLQKKASKESASLKYWKSQFAALKLRQFNSAVEVMNAAAKFQNQIALHEGLTYSQKKSLRRQVHQFEGARSAQFPPPQLVGFKRTDHDPNDPSKGYTVEPMYR